ncbi:hypothetical protein GCM10007036_39740 [Alsobacter metallidurans]|uniref:Uncharacterized protein n=1 Tax=Alsobacter metallidurans TaxID=340221 RepID=A0A917IC73_9HYPH|nr:hypothetical protein GCM10007036_39740 [Alsobacter metallidurans]
MAQGPDENRGLAGFWPGIAFVIDSSILADGRSALGRSVPPTGVGEGGYDVKRKRRPGTSAGRLSQGGSGRAADRYVVQYFRISGGGAIGGSAVSLNM